MITLDYGLGDTILIPFKVKGIHIEDGNTRYLLDAEGILYNGINKIHTVEAEASEIYKTKYIIKGVKEE